MSNNSREEILHTIRKGLEGVGLEETLEERNFLSETEEIQKLTKELQSKLKTQFVGELENVNTNVLEAGSEDEVKSFLQDLIKEKELKSFAIWESEFLKEMNLKQELKDAGLKLITAKNKNRIAKADIGITEVDYAIADTGTLVLLTDKNQPRSVSLLPPIHLAIVRPENLVRNINDLFIILKSRLPNTDDISSCMTFITGPSRTADIELNLTLGVHGPKELYVVILS
ncbi:MAG: lactate utilization protein [Deltaproteobacteria bacterium]|nr:lactate utilization protein [Deltaproteobacteria bacterium]MCK5709768.1 lactate utilization protein [Deltaproteobacteria bacterium]